MSSHKTLIIEYIGVIPCGIDHLKAFIGGLDVFGGDLCLTKTSVGIDSDTLL